MPNNEGNRYYWGLHSENATGENVGAVLDDLSDIEATPEEGLDDEHKAIIVEYDEDLGRNKFKLGAAGSKVEILGNDNQIVVADGEGNAKANTALFYAQTEGDPGTIAKLQTPMTSIEIGSTTSVPEKYWDNDKNNAKFFMSGSPLLQMMKREGSSPVISMLGAGVFEMYAYQNHNRQQDYTRALSRQSSSGEKCLSEVAYYAYNGTSPYGNTQVSLSNSEVFPYFHMSNSSTVIMEGASLIKMADSAGFEMAGNADVVIRGGALTDWTGSQINSGQIRTGLYMEPGAMIRMTRRTSTDGGAYGPMIAIESSNSGDKNSPGKLLLTAQHGIYNGIYDYNSNDHDFTISLSGRIIRLSDRIYNHRRFIYNENVNPGKIPSTLAPILFQPTLNIMGKTSLSIGDGGYFAAKIAPSSGAYTAIDWTGYGYEDIKIGTDKGAIVMFNMCHGSNAVATYNIEPASSSNTVFNYCPNGVSSINYSPKGSCAISFTPNVMTEITCQWDTLDALIEGDNAYVQTSGDFHSELHGGSFIMRTTTPANESIIYGGHPSQSHLGRDWTTFVQNDSEPVFQMYDESNFAMAADISREYTGEYSFTNSTTMSKSDFEVSTEYQDFLDELTEYNRTLISYTISNESSNSGYIVHIRYKFTNDTPRVAPASSTHAPVFEMYGESELRLRDGASIRGTTVNNEIQFQFDDGTNSVSFTVAELAALKTLLTQIPIQVVQSASEATEQGIMYFVNGGGN